MTLRRKAHVYRVYQTDDDGNVVDPDAWVDVMRIDRFSIESLGMPQGPNQGPNAQVINYYMDWGDDTKEWAKEREYTTLLLTEPMDGDGEINLPIVKKTRFEWPSKDDGQRGQIVRWLFKNDPDSATPTTRKFTPIRVLHNDLASEITMPDANAGDPPPTTTQGQRISWDDYAQALQYGTTDDSQFIDVEVTDRFKINWPTDAQGARDQRIVYALRQKQVSQTDPIGVEDLFSLPPTDSVETVWRTDPLQTIVNVSWGGLAVEFGDKDQDAPG